MSDIFHERSFRRCVRILVWGCMSRSLGGSLSASMDAQRSLNRPGQDHGERLRSPPTLPCKRMLTVAFHPHPTRCVEQQPTERRVTSKDRIVPTAKQDEDCPFGD